MGQVNGSAFCPLCKRQVRTVRNGTNHILHLLLSFFTLGFWLPVWVNIATRKQPDICNECGTNIDEAYNGKPEANFAGVVLFMFLVLVIYGVMATR
jgi:hypothetical protein